MAIFTDVTPAPPFGPGKIDVPNGDKTIYGWGACDVNLGGSLESKGFTLCSGIITTHAASGMCTLAHFPGHFGKKAAADNYVAFLGAYMPAGSKIRLVGNKTGADLGKSVAYAAGKAGLGALAYVAQPAFRALDVLVDGTGVTLTHRLANGQTQITVPPLLL